MDFVLKFEALNYSCDTAEEASDLSEICVESSNPPDVCFPKTITLTGSRIVGIWCALHAVVGCAGNLLTLAAIPYAIRHKRHGLHDNWKSTAFILNLSLADFLYCFLGLPFQSALYLMRRWLFGQTMCSILGSFRLMNAFADWMSLASIAANRCLSLTRPDLCSRWSSKRNLILAICSIWIYSFILLIPIFSGLGKFAYNCRLGICGFHSSVRHFSEIYFYGLGFFGPALISGVSYFIAWNHLRKFTSRVTVSNEQDGAKMNQLEIRITWTMALICFCYVILVLPICLLRVVDMGAVLGPKLHVAALCIYWCQYSFNFFIYALRCHQYRKAYLDFIKVVGRKSIGMVTRKDDEKSASF